jgi:hypothetical protein
MRNFWILTLIAMLAALTIVISCGDDDDDDDDDDAASGDDDDSTEEPDCAPAVESCVKNVSNENITCLNPCNDLTETCDKYACAMPCYSTSADATAQCILDNECPEAYTQADPVAFYQCQADCADAATTCLASATGDACDDCYDVYMTCNNGCSTQFN